MKAGGSEIGSWDLNDVSIEESEGAFRIIAEDESLILRVRDAKRFAGTVGVTISPAMSGDMATPIVPTPTKRAPDDMPLVVDEPISQPLPPSVPAHVPQASPAGPDETPLARHLSWSLVGVGALLFLGALLDWGAFRLTNNNFPFARLLVVLAGFASLAAAYLGPGTRETEGRCARSHARRAHRGHRDLDVRQTGRHRVGLHCHDSRDCGAHLYLGACLVSSRGCRHRTPTSNPSGTISIAPLVEQTERLLLRVGPVIKPVFGEQPHNLADFRSRLDA